MANKQTLGQLVSEELRESKAMYRKIAGLSDRALAAEFKRVQAIYDDRCAEYVNAGEIGLPRPPKELNGLLEACIARLES